MKRFRLIAVGAAGGVLGLVLLLLSGLLNFAASSGHWDVTDWMLDIGARQSVTLRSLNIDVPLLDDPAMIRRGAGHYELVCATCHGSPARPPEELAQHLTPSPPLLVEQMQHWRPPARTFWTVKHGIKRTAMPAWPTQLRDDEIWDVVAFIEAMPALTADQYRQLAGDRRAESICANCHGDGTAGAPGIPRLDIQSPDYLRDALTAFRDGTRASGIMTSAASGLGDEQIAELAATLGHQHRTQGKAASAGRTIAEEGLPDRGIPACESCHGATARADYPRLTGQDEAYLVRQLTLFLSLGEQRGGRHAGIMAEAVDGLTPAEVEAVAAWYGR